MDRSSQTLQFLSQSFLDLLSPHPVLRRRGEENLSDAADTPNYGLNVLRLVAEPSVDEQIRECAAVNFNNHIKTRWLPSSFSPIPDGEKEQIKTLIVPLLLSAAPKIKIQISDAIAVIGHHGYSKLWPTLLSELKSSLKTAINGNDFASVICILTTLNSLFMKFRPQFKTNDILLDMTYSLRNFGKTLLSSVKSISRKIKAVAGRGSVATLRQLLEAQWLCFRIFYSLIFSFVPGQFSDKEDEWMNEFKNNLTVKYPAIEDGNDADSLLLVDELRAAVCDNLSHYLENTEEVFQKKHLNDFVKGVRRLLVVASASPSRERLTVAGIKFLTVVSKRFDHDVFDGDEILQQITQSNIIPHVMLRGADEKMFRLNYVEFIRRDMEEEVDTRSRIACELINKETIRAQIHHSLALFYENPAGNWKYKECAIYLVVSLATKNSTDIVDIESFFTLVIVPELQCEDGFPMLKAASLKFLTKLHDLIPKHEAMPLLLDVVRFLGSNVTVVQSYAAMCIEKLLRVNHNGVVRYTSLDIDPIVEDLMNILFDELKKSPVIHVIMTCIMHVLQITDKCHELVSRWEVELEKVLESVKKSPNDQKFNHYLFEAIATLIKKACEKEPRLVTAFQSFFTRNLPMVFDKAEFVPYGMQLLAQLVDLNGPPVPSIYMDIFEDLLLCQSDFLENSANVPALVLVIQSLLQQAPDEVTTEGRLRLVIGIFNKLVSSPSTEEEGFDILNSVIENYEYRVIAEYMDRIWATLFTRLQNSKTPRLVRGVMVFMSMFLVKHGVQTLVDLINSGEVNLFHVILNEFWIPNLGTMSTTGYNEIKLCAVASTKLLCESATLLDPSAEEFWGKLLDAIVTLLTLPLSEEERVVDNDDDGFDFGGSFICLRNAVTKKEEEDHLKEIEDPKQFLVSFPAKISCEFRGKFPLVIMRHLSPINQAALVKLCKSYNIAIV